jgi:hypothetical protein
MAHCLPPGIWLGTSPECDWRNWVTLQVVSLIPLLVWLSGNWKNAFALIATFKGK